MVYLQELKNIDIIISLTRNTNYLSFLTDITLRSSNGESVYDSDLFISFDGFDMKINNSGTLITCILKKKCICSANKI